MTIKEFEEAKAAQSDFQKWFEERAWHTVNTAGAEFPCVKIGRKKAGLSDGAIFTVNDANQIASIEKRDKTQCGEYNGR